MADDIISVTHLAEQLGKRKQSIFKILKRLKIEPQKLTKADRRGQLVSFVTVEESRLVAAELRTAKSKSSSGDGLDSSPEALLSERGVFYLLLLEPEHDPGRFKVGFTINLAERLRTLRCSAPFLRVVDTWPCKMLWERTAIECVTKDCMQLHTEVFRTESIEPVHHLCQQFFSLMPRL